MIFRTEFEYKEIAEIDDFLKVDSKWVDENYKEMCGLTLDTCLKRWPVETTKIYVRRLLGLSNLSSDIQKRTDVKSFQEALETKS